MKQIYAILDICIQNRERGFWMKMCFGFMKVIDKGNFEALLKFA